MRSCHGNRARSIVIEMLETAGCSARTSWLDMCDEQGRSVLLEFWKGGYMAPGELRR